MSPDNVPRDILSRIRKLMRLEEGAKAVGSMEEANNASAALSRLLTKYNLTLGEVPMEEEQEIVIDREFLDPERHGIPSSRRRIAWQEGLMRVVTKATFCRFAVIAGTNCFEVVGTRQNREVCIYLFTYLTREIARLSYKSYCDYYAVVDKQGHREKALGYRQSWIGGAISALSKRLQAEFQQVISEAPNSERALLVINAQWKLLDDWMEQAFKGKAKGLDPGQIANIHAMREGQEWGKTVPINKGLSPTTDKTHLLEGRK